MKRKRTPIPQFKSLEEEMEFWSTHSATEFDLWDVTSTEVAQGAVKKPRKRSITLKLDERVIKKLRLEAKQRGVSDDAIADELLRKQLKEIGRASCRERV